ncbi:MAG: hypothetical protein HY426_02495 [Candidatus Levybacteria bacterium]|nr:hypothetical protein [Candidatus Levybacteria bacterium]
MEQENQVPPQVKSQPNLLKDKRKLAVFLFPVFAVLTLILVLTLFFINSKKPTTPTPTTTKEVSTVAPKTEYSNPFDKDSQYVNPFSSYKNPFDNLK